MANPPPLRDYQRLGVDYVTNVKKCGLWLEPGLGKTATVLSAIDDSWGPVLVIAPKRVAEETWPEELDMWRPDLSYALAAGTPAEREAAFLSGADVTIVSRDNAVEAVNRRSARRRKWRTIIYDESSGLKSQGTARYKVAKHLGDRAERFITLTGTPSPNGLMDIWAPMKLLDDGAALGKNLTGYRARYFYAARQMPNGVVTQWDLLDGAEQEIYSRIEGTVLGMQAKYRLQLPDVTHSTIPVGLPSKVRQLYNRLKDELVVDIEDVLGFETFTAGNAAILSSKLSQIAAGALYPDLDSERAGKALGVHRSRFDAWSGILEAATSPVLVLYRFRFEAEEIRRRFPQARSVQERGIVKQWNSGDVPILFGHPASCGHGLNLQRGGSHALWTSPTWDLELWEQANKRLDRPGQTRPVTIQTVLSPGTVDTRVLARVREKATDQIRLKEAIESPI